MDITIVIPIYNREEYLDRTLRSIPDHYPLILVDNGSTDASAQMAAAYCEKRNATDGAAPALFAVETQKGAAAARNRGLALCRTEWIYFFDSDDDFTALPDVPEDTPPAPAPDMICFPVTMVVGGREYVRSYRPVADAPTHILTTMLSTQSMLFSTEWLRSIGGWDARLRIWDDWELGLRALLHNPRLEWRTECARHRIYVHDDSLTGPSYSARADVIVEALTTAYDDIRRLAGTTLPDAAHTAARCRRALDLRTHIVAGTLRREGAAEAAGRVRCLVDHPTRLGRTLEWFTAHGGRGAWRIALRCL